MSSRRVLPPFFGRYCATDPLGEGWSGNTGLFFHVYPHNSVQSFHLHIVDLDVTGPTYEVMKYKNMPAEDVLAVLRAEAAGQL